MEEERSDRKGEILTQPHQLSAANTFIPSTLPSNLVPNQLSFCPPNRAPAVTFSLKPTSSPISPKSHSHSLQPTPSPLSPILHPHPVKALTPDHLPRNRP
ncbi:hypothetical protein D8674_002173 [Pyrus ussuriensis x Pyrus communis]|uniref:Uncharacterized protein n=1 Tax=Pyrus ussuriensis x Pyrus communis TaxID=2448454 RepID=A0A5N5FDI2_9ROSA|nr:hypothetical protein D8674_002173 [Pyrus ussuriensis x Pyrus communis]